MPERALKAVIQTLEKEGIIVILHTNTLILAVPKYTESKKWKLIWDWENVFQMEGPPTRIHRILQYLWTSADFLSNKVAISQIS